MPRKVTKLDDMAQTVRCPPLAECVATGYVMPGWTPERWRDRLLLLADKLERWDPATAAAYRQWAESVIKHMHPEEEHGEEKRGREAVDGSGT